MFKTISNKVLDAYTLWKLPPTAKAERRADHRGLPEKDPGIPAAVEAALGWLRHAQASSTSRDGGAARFFSLIDGWSSSYPETTGYIIPVLLAGGVAEQESRLTASAKRMLDWLVSIQFENGGFQGGLIDSTPVRPVTFNTGSVLLGLAAGAQRFGEPYHTALIKAADWLVATQDEDGYWRDFPSPFAPPGEKAYYAHIAWSLLKAANVAAREVYAQSALRLLDWTLAHQKPNGWFSNCCLSNPEAPLTHTIGFALRGIVEGYLYSNRTELLEAALRTADGLAGVIDRDTGYLPGRIDSGWKGCVSWVCPTGTAQISACWMLLYQITGNKRYWEAATAANRFLRRIIKVDGNPDTRGALKGSYPVDGAYGPYRFINGAFFIESNQLEHQVQTRTKPE